MYQTLIVMDRAAPRPLDLEVIDFDHYLSDYPKRGEPRTRVINLCDTATYLSRGYYCSLLAESRQHKVLPSVSTVNDLRIAGEPGEGLQLTAALVPKQAKANGAFPERLDIFFGWTEDESWRKLARAIYERFPAPVLRVQLTPAEPAIGVQVERASLSQLDEAGTRLFFERLNAFTRQVWRMPVGRRRPRWDMAILHDPEEANPPSDPEAIRRFVKAASKVGIEAELVRSDQLRHVGQYDALFIRETTRIDHPTYRLARKGEMEGLVVIDDATSILRCCNKIFLHDAFTYNGVHAPKTLVVSGCAAAEVERIEANFDFPMVLKMPESSFSVGVYKVKARAELEMRLREMLADSALLLVQEYIYTEFDWRIGVLNGRAIYACKYFMARGHWQIYDHAAKGNTSGGFETIPTFETPRRVLDAALKASAIIGRGLYGVDLKEVGKEVYVIEVNDNPSIDHGVEDDYLGDELYMMIMQEFVNRLEQRGRV